MTAAVEFVDAGDSLAAAARRMRDTDVGALPVRGPGDRLLGIITDRDIVVKAIASDLDPRQCPVRTLIDSEPVCVGAHEDVEQAAAMMAEHRIRRLPVVDGGRLVGMVAQADVVRALPPERGGRVVREISQQDAGAGPV
ncbi:MAG: CBS domain-containing protein [Catenulispora sp.]|nr:CBS domain-containing protein [Catenulispora sp.]